MSENQQLLDQLGQLVRWKKSKKFYAEKLGISEEEVSDLLKELKEIGIEEVTETVDGSMMVKFSEDVQKGTGEVVFNSDAEIKTLDELIEKCNIDTTKWEITKYVQNYWGNAKNPYWQVKAWLSKKVEEQLFQDNFLEFLSNYEPEAQPTNKPNYNDKDDACLIINKQDAHYNKKDIDGHNDMTQRFVDVREKINIIINQASLSNYLTNIKYIIGSDEFNSEFTGTTTKGTPQSNTDSYYDSFRKICNHEIGMIHLLLESAESVDVIFVSGNHDEFVGWHMIHFLQSYFRNEKRINFDTSPKYRKYVSYGDSAMMFNHGDAIKPAKLAAIFPIEFREDWSYHSNFYIFTGDKHHEVSQDFNGIKFYQIPAFSNAKSVWDDKMGHVCSKAEVTGFLIDYEQGMTNIFKQYL
jgi:hypothetical protein